jgi:hypothetical protein
MNRVCQTAFRRKHNRPRRGLSRPPAELVVEPMAVILGILRSQADDITVVKAAVNKMTMIDGTIFKRTILEAAVNEFAIFFCNTLVFLVFYEPFLIAGYLHISVPPSTRCIIKQAVVSCQHTI